MFTKLFAFSIALAFTIHINSVDLQQTFRQLLQYYITAICTINIQNIEYCNITQTLRTAKVSTGFAVLLQ